MYAILLAALVSADVEPGPAPKARALPPMLLVASASKGRIVSRREVVEAVPVTVTEKVNVNGREEERTITKYVTQVRMVEQAWELKKVKAGTAGGKKLDAEAVEKRLGKAQAIIVSADGKEVDPVYLKLFDKDALVIVPVLDQDKRQ